MQSKKEEELVSSLTNLVKAARKVPLTESTKTDNENDASVVQKALRRLYPSGCKITPDGISKNTTSKRKNEFSPSLSQVWGRQKKQTKKVSKAKKITESLKDIIFLNDPGIAEVPRKSERKYFYESGLVALAVKFTSDMDNFKVREVIMDNFTCDEEFDFMKPIENTLVCPLNQDWDYKTMKHLTGQSPIYISSKKYFTPPTANVKDNVSEDIDDEVFYQNPFKQKNKGENSVIVIEENIPCSSKKNSDSDVKIKNITATERSLPCPICKQQFAVSLIEDHAQSCAEQKFDLIMYSSSSDEEDIGNKTLPYIDEHIEVSEQDAIIKRNEILENIIVTQKMANVEVFKCRRACVWKDFISHRKKSWSHVNNNLMVTFVKESAVDSGGPKREFFSGKVYNNYFE